MCVTNEPIVTVNKGAREDNLQTLRVQGYYLSKVIYLYKTITELKFIRTCTQASIPMASRFSLKITSPDNHKSGDSAIEVVTRHVLIYARPFVYLPISIFLFLFLHISHGNIGNMAVTKACSVCGTEAKPLRCGRCLSRVYCGQSNNFVPCGLTQGYTASNKV